MNTGTDLHRQALNELGNALRRLTANLIEIVRGAGKPLDLSRNDDAFTAALTTRCRQSEQKISFRGALEVC